MDYALGIEEITDDLAAVVDADRSALGCAWEIDRGEHALVVVQEKAMKCVHRPDMAYDLAAIVDATGRY